MFGLFWGDYLGILKLSVQNALMASILVLALSAAIISGISVSERDVE